MKEFFKQIKKELNVKKAILILILTGFAVFTFLQSDSFIIVQSYLNGEKIHLATKSEMYQFKEEPEKVTNQKDDALKYKLRVPTGKKLDLKPNDTVTQKFKAVESSIKRVNLLFNNPDTARTKGVVSVAVIDKDGKTVCETELKASMITNDSLTMLDFTGSSEEINTDRIVKKKVSVEKIEGIDLNKGEAYTLRIKCKNVLTKSGFGIYLCEEKYDDGFTLSHDSKKTDDHIMGALAFLHKNIAVIFVFILAYLLGILMILMPLGYCSQLLSRKRGKDTDLNKLFSRILFLLSPFAAFFLSCKALGLRTTTTLQLLLSLEGFMNIFILVVLLLIFYLIFNRIKYANVFLVLLITIFSIVNYFLIIFRDSPLVAADFASIGTAMDVAANYTLVFKKSFLWVLTIGSVYIAFSTSLIAYKSLQLKRRLSLLVICMLLVGAGYWMFWSKNAPANMIRISGFDSKRSYKKRGSTLAFLLTIKASRIEKPENYSLDEVKKIASNYRSDKAIDAKKTNRSTPNIIAIMNEAYSDLSYIGKLKTSAPFMPYFDSLKENTIKGRLHTSIFGGSTANTEYEFLTGNSLAFMPLHIVAYNSKVHEGHPSIARQLTANGYGGNISFHPGTAESYNRNVVYPYLGFKKHLSLEDYKNPDRVRAYVSDKFDFQQIIKEYEKYRQSGKENPFWLFNVTIQNHSDFKYSSGVVEKRVKILDDAVVEEQAEQYLNLIRITDDALKMLVEYFSNVNEPTVIVMFGDHQPRVGDEFYNALESRNTYNSSLEKTEGRFQVPFMIWSNYDIKEQQDVQISANYLGSYILDKLKLPMTGYDKFLMDTYKKVPVITSVCNIDNKGVMHANGSKYRYSDQINKYQCLQYNNVVDYENRLNDFFELKQ